MILLSGVKINNNKNESNEKQSIFYVRERKQHTLGDVFPSGVNQSQPSKHVAFICKAIGVHGICGSSPPLPLFCPQENISRHQGRRFQHVATGRLLLTLQRPPLISTFQLPPRRGRGGCQGAEAAREHDLVSEL